MLRIVDKRTNGLLTQHKYAQDEMARFLVRIGNDMDNRGEDELRVLADDCLEGLKKKADGEGWFDKLLSNTFSNPEVDSNFRPIVSALRFDTITVPLAIALALAVPSLGIPVATALSAGATAGIVLGPLMAYLITVDSAATTILNDGTEVLNAIDNVLTPSFLNFGVVNEAESVPALTELKTAVKGLISAASPLHDSLSKLKPTGSEASHIADTAAFSKSLSRAEPAMKAFEAACKEYNTKLPIIQTDYDAEIKQNHPTAGDTLVRLRNWANPMLGINPISKLSSKLATLKSAVNQFKIGKGTAEKTVAQRAESAAASSTVGGASSALNDEFKTEPTASQPAAKPPTDSSVGEEAPDAQATETQSKSAPEPISTQKAAYVKSLVTLIKKSS